MKSFSECVLCVHMCTHTGIYIYLCIHMHIYTYTYTYMYIYSILILCNTMDSILKSRDITLSTKVRLVKATVFPVVMYGCESWTIRRMSAEELILSNCGVEEDS